MRRFAALLSSAIFISGIAAAQQAPSIASGQNIAIALAAGGQHTCALTQAGGVKCWGSNGGGELGDGTTDERDTPVFVSHLKSGIVAITAGTHHTCALTAGGGVLCWGFNYFGQLGDGTTNEHNTPEYVQGLKSGVVAIAAGGVFTCAALQRGGVKCWGYNQFGELGNGTIKTDPTTTPVSVSRIKTTITALAAAVGGAHVCALTGAGGVECWGDNYDGQLGDGTRKDRSKPVGVTGLDSGVAAITVGGASSCALTKSDAAMCWGYNGEGQLGDKTYRERHTPVFVHGLESGVANIGAGDQHACAVTTKGGALCWGYNNDGELGDGTTDTRNVPGYVSGLKRGMAAVAGGSLHTCGLTTAGKVYCWGDDGLGELGDNKASGGSSTTPVRVVGF